MKFALVMTVLYSVAGAMNLAAVTAHVMNGNVPLMLLNGAVALVMLLGAKQHHNEYKRLKALDAPKQPVVE
jgi:hypothetical protein